MELPRDKNGKTEAEFLRDYNVTKYFRPSVTVDAVLYRRAENGRLRILFIKRGGHPFIGKYAFPGGFVEQSEPCEDAAYRELNEETGVTGVPLRQLVTASAPDRDPRWRNITAVFCGEAGEISAQAGDDAADAQWFDIAYNREDGTLLFECAQTSERFECRLDIRRDAFGKIDLNKTRILERGLTAFDHAAITAYLFESVFDA